MQITPLRNRQASLSPASLSSVNVLATDVGSSSQVLLQKQSMSSSAKLSVTTIANSQSRETICSLEQQDQPEQQSLSPVISCFDSEGQLDHHILIHKSNNSCSSFQSLEPQMDNLISSQPHITIPAHTHNQYYMQSQQQHPQNLDNTCQLTPAQSPGPQKESPTTDNSDSAQENHSHIGKSSPANTPQFASNCQTKLESKASMKQSSPAMNTIIQPPLRPTEPKKGLYYKNRARLHQWLRAECTKFELSRDTFANAVFMMDEYFKNCDFDSHQFLPIALCMVIIAAKMNEVKILYTVRMAHNSVIPVQKLLRLEVEVLQWFKFKTNPYNFAKILTEYMRRWDQTAKSQRIQAPLLLEDTLQSFLLYQQLFHLCQQQLRFNRQLLVPTIKIIFELVMATRMAATSSQQIIDIIFGQENIFARGQISYVFQCGDQSCERNKASLLESVKAAMESFQAKKKGLTQKYHKCRADGDCYSNLINLQF